MVLTFELNGRMKREAGEHSAKEITGCAAVIYGEGGGVCSYNAYSRSRVTVDSSPTGQALRVPSAMRREVYGEEHEGGGLSWGTADGRVHSHTCAAI